MPKKKKSTKPKAGEPREKTDFKTSVSFHEPEDDTLCSSSYFHEAIVYKPKDLKQKLMIATNISIECKEQMSKLAAGKYVDAKDDSILKRLNVYTNLPIDELKLINDQVRTRDRSFEKALKDIKTIHYPTLGILCDDIRDIFLKFVVEKKTLPSKIDLLKDLKTRMNKYTNEIISIQRLVKNKLIKYQFFPKFNRYLLSEHPERVYQRTVYLNNVIEHRKQNKSFVYVEVKRIVPRSTSSGFIAGLAAFPSAGKLEKFFTKDSAELIAKKWLQQRILPLIPEGSLVVLSQPKKRNKVSIHGKKTDLISWLEDNGIPYDNTHTAELYTLYNRFRTKIKEQGIYDHVFLNAGFEVIHCPVEWASLNFFKVVWADLEVMDAYHTGRPEALKQKILNATMTISNLEDTEKSLIEEEFKVMMEDNAMEEIVEKVLVMMKDGDVQAQEFPNECCGDKIDYFEMRVSDIILDNIT